MGCGSSKAASTPDAVNTSPAPSAAGQQPAAPATALAPTESQAPAPTAAAAPAQAAKPAAAHPAPEHAQHTPHAQHAQQLGQGLQGQQLAQQLTAQPPSSQASALLFGTAWRAQQSPEHLTQLVREDPDVGDAGPLMASAASLAWLQQLVAQHGALTPDQLAAQVVGPATRGSKARYLDVAGPASSAAGQSGAGLPTYWVWLEPSWQHPLSTLMDIVTQHIQAMDPELPPSAIRVWLEAVSCHAQAGPEAREGARAAAREWLTSSSYAKPTLVVLQRVQPGDSQPLLRSNDAVGGGASNFTHQQQQQRQQQGHDKGGPLAAAGGDGAHPIQQQVVVPQGPGRPGWEPQQLSGLRPSAGIGGQEVGYGAPQDANNGAGGGGSGTYQQQPQQVTHLPVLVLWRNMQGLHGFHKAWFDTLNMVHLD